MLLCKNHTKKYSGFSGNRRRKAFFRSHFNTHFAFVSTMPFQKNQEKSPEFRAKRTKIRGFRMGKNKTGSNCRKMEKRKTGCRRMKKGAIFLFGGNEVCFSLQRARGSIFRICRDKEDRFFAFAPIKRLDFLLFL